MVRQKNSHKEQPQVTIYRAIEKFKEPDVLNDEMTLYQTNRFLTLTEKGRRVAEKLNQIEEILESS